MRLSFSKYSGCGNDFILIDNRLNKFNLHDRQQVARLCHRQLGIGADGVILLEKSQTLDFRMRIFNSDGSEAESCGNGIRCLARFIHDLGIPGSHFSIEMMQSNVEVILSDNRVSVKMPNPIDIHYSLSLKIDDSIHIVHHLDTGVPHTVLFVKDLEDHTLMALAPKIRYHPRFSKGTNVNFAFLTPEGTVKVRTYERGVEGETLACGTGATAVAIVAAHIHGLKSPVTICPRSNTPLYISFSGSTEAPENLMMTGPSTKVFEGTISIEEKSCFSVNLSESQHLLQPTGNYYGS